MRNILKNFTLLYAEDELDIQEQMKEYFDTFFKTTYVASNGKDALELYKTHMPDVMILDIYMPGINGLELTELIRSKDFNTKIIIMSAYSESSLVLQAIDANVTNYIVKPATVDKIKDALYKLSMQLMRDKSKIVRFSDSLFYNIALKRLIENDQEVELSHKTAKLLEILVSNLNQSVSTPDIINFVWDDLSMDISFDSVKTQVSLLRKKLPKNSLMSVYGVGYILKA